MCISGQHIGPLLSLKKTPNACLLSVLLSILLLVEGVNGLDVTPTSKRKGGTPTFDTTSPSSSPLLLLHNFGSSLTSCAPVNVTWAYAGPPLPLDLIATNIGVIPPTSQVSRTNTFTDGQVFGVPSGVSQQQPTQVFIAQSILPQASAVPWDVNVPTGWYQIFADFESTFEAQTDPFFVQPGTDTSCLLGHFQTASIHSPTSTEETPLPTTSPSGAGQPGQSAASQHPTIVNRDTHVGMIAGLSAGLITSVAVIVLLCWWYRKRRRNRINMPAQRSAYGILAESVESLMRTPGTLLGDVLRISVPQNQSRDIGASLDSMSERNLVMESGSGSRLSHSTITASTLPSYRSRTTDPPQYQSPSSDRSWE